MSVTSPAVSVCLLTYNHEKYVAAAIDSVLAQTFDDLELRIIDDGSSDRTPDIIASYADPRIVSMRKQNEGPSIALNQAIAAARGQYLALMSGDDVCHPDRLARQWEAYRRGGARLLFSGVDFIDDAGQPYRGHHFAEGSFDIAPRTRAQILERLFYCGNFINAVTCFTETRLLKQERPFDPLLFQLQDYDLWVRSVKKYDFAFLPCHTVSYRIRTDQQNLSAPNPGTLNRTANEHYLVLRRFFDDLSPALFREAFRDHLLRPDCDEPLEIACEQAFLYYRSPHPQARLLGCAKLYDLLSSPAGSAILENRYGYRVRDFVDSLKAETLVGRADEWCSLLYVDSGHGFNEEEMCLARVPGAGDRFDLSFELTRFPLVKGLRWDPLELRFCSLRLDEITLEASTGKTATLDATTLRTNGVALPDGALRFDTLDPQVFVPFQGTLARIALRGTWQVLSREESLLRAHRLLLSGEEERKEHSRPGIGRFLAVIRQVLTGRRGRRAA